MRATNHLFTVILTACVIAAVLRFGLGADLHACVHPALFCQAAP